jgi:hypothetical protein
METLTISYSKRNTVARNLLNTLAKTNGVKMYVDDTVLTPEEIIRVEKSMASGICTDISILQDYIKSQI